MPRASRAGLFPLEIGVANAVERQKGLGPFVFPHGDIQGGSLFFAELLLGVGRGLRRLGV